MLSLTLWSLSRLVFLIYLSFLLLPTLRVYPAGWRFMQEVEDLTCLILRELEESYPWMARSIEQVGWCVWGLMHPMGSTAPWSGGI